MAAKPLLYNAVRHEKIVEAVRRGAYRTEAARVVGIGGQTLWTWLDEGGQASDADIPYDEPAGRYRKLYEDVVQAEAEYILELRDKINVAAKSEKPNTWQAAAWTLERMHPEKYGRRDTTVIEGGDKPITQVGLVLIANPEAQEAANEMLKSLTRQRELPPGVPELPAPSMADVIEVEKPS